MTFRTNRKKARPEPPVDVEDVNDAPDLPPGIIRARSVTNVVSVPKNAPVSSEPSFVQGRVGTGTITAIETQEKRANRVNIYIDGKFALGLFDDVAHTLGLRVGQAITPDRLTEIAGEETRRRAFEAAIYLLGFRARSEHEIRDRLRRKEYENEVIEATIEKLRTGGYLDDSTFAQGWVQGRGKSRGRRALAFELRQKGIVGEVAQEALNETRTDEDEQTAAFAVAVKRVGERPSDTSREAQAKLSAYLGRRGFGWSEIRPVLSRLYNRDESEEE